MTPKKDYKYIYRFLIALFSLITGPFLLAGIIEILRKIFHFNIPDKCPYLYITTVLFFLEFIILVIILYGAICYQELIIYKDNNKPPEED